MNNFKRRLWQYFRSINIDYRKR